MFALCPTFSVLPVSIIPETAVTLYIQHDDKVEQSLESGNAPQVRTAVVNE